MLNRIKTNMLITHDKLDSVIQNNIDACLIDLKRMGVVPKEKDELITKAVELYCKWQLNFCGEGEKYEKAYYKLSDALALCGDYNA